MQQHRAFLKESVSNPKLKKRILTDLAAFITIWHGINTHSNIVVMLEANSDCNDPQFKAFIADTALHNVVVHHSSEACNQSTYINGEKRLDYILVLEEY